MIARRIRLVAGIAAACLLSSGAAVAADEDAEQKTPDRVTEQEVEEMREDAVETGTVLPKESWTSGQSTGHAPALLDQEGPLTEQQADVLREQAEAMRVQAEALREQAETMRVQAEALRVRADSVKPKISDQSTSRAPPPPPQDEEPISDKEVQALRQHAKDREPLTKGSWTSGESTGHEPAMVEREEENDNSKDKDDE